MNVATPAIGAGQSAPRLHVDSVGAGPPLVLLHGFALHGGLFGPLLPVLAQRRRVHVADLPGHGRSAAREVASLDAMVAALDDAFAREDAPLDIVGWSLGGAVALRWAAMRPARVARLVLVATTPSFVAREGWPHAMADATLAKFGDELAVAYRLTLKRFLTLQTQGSDSGRAALAALRHQLFARGEPTAAALARALRVLRGIDLRTDVAAVRAPALIVAGDRDTLAPREAAAWLANALPDGRLVEIPGAAHAPFLSHPEAFVDAVNDFLDRTSPRSDAR